jgi:DNA-binding beta-propeller fold protein YncE
MGGEWIPRSAESLALRGHEHTGKTGGLMYRRTAIRIAGLDFNNVHGIAVDPTTRRVFVNDRGNHRAQVFDENGKFLDSWKFGDAPSDIHSFHIVSDGYRWAADRGTNKILEYDLNGNFMYSWGMWGEHPGSMWAVP